MATVHHQSGLVLDPVTGIGGVPVGGTGSNMSATGGAGHVVMQPTVGGGFTTAALPAINAVVDHGLVAGGSAAANTTAILAAVAAAESTGRPIYIPPGDFTFDAGAAAYAAKITKSLDIGGSGAVRTILRLATGTPTTTDMFLYEPASANEGSFLHIHDLRITTATAGEGRYGIHIKPAGFVAKRFIIERVWVPGGSLSSFGIYLDGSVLADSIFQGTIRDCQLSSNGIGGVDVVDSMIFDNNALSGTGYGIDVTFNGGGNSSVTRNNITATGGVRIRGNHANFHFDDNYVEVIGTYTGANNAMVDLDGDTGTLTAPIVKGNLFTIINTGTQADGLRLAKTNGARVESGMFTVQDSTAAGIRIESTALRTYVAPSVRWTSVGTPMIDGSGNDISGRVGDVIAYSYAVVATSGTAEETVFTHSLNATTLYRDGQTIAIDVGAAFAANTNSKVLRVKWGGTTVHSWSTVSASATGAFETTYIARTGASTQRIWGRRDLTATTGNAATTTATATDTAAITISVTLETSGAAGDATVNMVVVRMVN